MGIIKQMNFIFLVILAHTRVTSTLINNCNAEYDTEITKFSKLLRSNQNYGFYLLSKCKIKSGKRKCKIKGYYNSSFKKKSIDLDRDIAADANEHLKLIEKIKELKNLKRNKILLVTQSTKQKRKSFYLNQYFPQSISKKEDKIFKKISECFYKNNCNRGILLFKPTHFDQSNSAL